MSTTELLNPGLLLLAGFMGASHCIGMCGGIAAAIGAGTARITLISAYNIGRITSYMLAGGLAGTLGMLASDYLALGPVLRTLAGLLLVLMGLYLANWWRVLTRLEQGGLKFWRLIQPLVTRFSPASKGHHALLLGMLWGWLPCGLVYSALAFAAASGSTTSGMFAMLAFGAGTLPAMLASGWIAGHFNQVSQRFHMRQVMGILMILMGVWNIWVVNQHSHHGLHEVTRHELHFDSSLISER